MIQAFLRKAGLLATFALASLSSQAQTVSVGLASDITSADPHYHLVWSNMNVSEHIFSRLIERDKEARLVSGLALSWRAVDDTTWEFKLRPNVSFHDGSPFTADDVVFSIERVATIKDSPGSFSIYTKAITSMTVVDPLTVRFNTAAAHPLLPAELAAIAIVSKKAASGASTADFNSGKAAIGTGPYKLVRYARGDRIEMTRNDAYWGKKPQVENLTFKLLPNAAARVAALLSNDVQIIEAVPVADLRRMQSLPDVSVYQHASTRAIFLNMDSSRDQSPFVTDKDGKPLANNPLKDVRVRKALSKAIDRNMIQTRVMDGASQPAAQFMIPGLSGYSAKLKAETVDVEGAKKLLAEAGYPNGFGLTLHGSNNRYVQDAQILQALAQMLSRVGIDVKVEAQPSSVFFSRQSKGEYSFSMSGWGSSTFEGSSPLRAVIATRDVEKGLGLFNAGRYSNRKVDELIDKATRTIDDTEREALLQQATEAAMADQAVIPVHHQVNLWAARKPLVYGGRADERTYGFDFVIRQP